MKSMLLITSTWGQGKTFKLIPLTEECPYNEVIFDPENKMLAIISKEKKESLHMLAKLNEYGDPIKMKIGRRDNGKDYSEERKTLESFYEYYLEDANEIKSFLEMVAVNYNEFDVAKYLEVQTPKIEAVANKIVTV